ncbi:MAG: RNase adapter RapZ [Desulfobacterales bacterium]|nr:RNase adapter RapZ [Desulfobacterales bacterium]
MKTSTIFIVTGRSGSGKSTAIAAFEDAGLYCVDNMPVALLPPFLKLTEKTESEIDGFAFVMDLREQGFLDKYGPIFQSLRKGGYRINLLFLEADEKTLLRRYSQTRRHHPLAKEGQLLEGIRAEKRMLQQLRTEASKVINTSQYNVHELKNIISKIAQHSTKLTPLKISVLSFGFKFGLPPEADLVVDVRFLPNPYFVPELKALSGEDRRVRDYVLDHPETKQFINKYSLLLDYLIPRYEKEGKAYLTIAVGCTGGRHRSVAIAKYLFDHLKRQNRQIDLAHRDINQ